MRKRKEKWTEVHSIWISDEITGFGSRPHYSFPLKSFTISFAHDLWCVSLLRESIPLWVVQWPRNGRMSRRYGEAPDHWKNTTGNETVVLSWCSIESALDYCTGSKRHTAVPFVFSVDVSAMLQQQLHCLHPIVACGQMQGGWLWRTANNIIRK